MLIHYGTVKGLLWVALESVDLSAAVEVYTTLLRRGLSLPF